MKTFKQAQEELEKGCGKLNSIGMCCGRNKDSFGIIYCTECQSKISNLNIEVMMLKEVLKDIKKKDLKGRFFDELKQKIEEEFG